MITRTLWTGHESGWLIIITHKFNKKAGVSYNFKRKSPKLNDVEDVDDLLIGDFHDSFHNLTYKDSMLVNWVKHDCPSAEVGFHWNFFNYRGPQISVMAKTSRLIFWKPCLVCFQRRWWHPCKSIWTEKTDWYRSWTTIKIERKRSLNLWFTSWNAAGRKALNEIWRQLVA